jgi:hypothetical protein
MCGTNKNRYSIELNGTVTVNGIDFFVHGETYKRRLRGKQKDTEKETETERLRNREREIEREK